MERAARGLPALSRRGCRVSAVRGPVPPGLSLPGVPRGGAGVGRFKGSGSPRPQESGAAQHTHTVSRLTPSGSTVHC